MGSLHRQKSRQPTTTATMKLNISFPANGSQKLIEIEDDRKLRVFMDKRMGQEVPGDSVGDEFKGYIFKITGGNDKQGFPMKQGVMHPTRVRLLLSDGHSCYRPRRTGERKRKSVRGCIAPWTSLSLPSPSSSKATSSRATSSRSPAVTTSKV